MFGEALDAVEYPPAAGENFTDVGIGLRIETQAEARDAIGRQFFDGFFCIRAQLGGVGDIDVGGGSIGQDKEDFLARPPGGKHMAGMAQGGAHPR